MGFPLPPQSLTLLLLYLTPSPKHHLFPFFLFSPYSHLLPLRWHFVFLFPIPHAYLHPILFSPSSPQSQSVPPAYLLPHPVPFPLQATPASQDYLFPTNSTPALHASPPTLCAPLPRPLQALLAHESRRRSKLLHSGDSRCLNVSGTCTSADVDSALSHSDASLFDP